MSDDLVPVIRTIGGDPADLPFWAACREGRFLLHACKICSRAYWPASRCVDHGAAAMEWIEGSGRGALYTYTIMHHSYSPAWKDKTPYAVAVVQLDEGPFFHTNIVECANEKLEIGMKLQAQMIAHESGLTVPVFKPV